ncbi:MAG: hypothetical protein Kow002_16330 [Anaerolineales bacterium]
MPLFQKKMPNRKAWQKTLSRSLGRDAAKQLVHRVQEDYLALLAGAGKFPNRALQKTHLETNILPTLALYRALIGDGMEQDDAIALTEQCLDVVAQQQRRRFQALARTPLFFKALKRVLRPSMARNFPAPGFTIEWPALGENETGFNIRGCFYVNVLGEFGAPELVSLFCNVDDVVFENTPGVQWKRENTIGRGGEYCDFRYIKK